MLEEYIDEIEPLFDDNSNHLDLNNASSSNNNNNNDRVNASTGRQSVVNRRRPKPPNKRLANEVLLLQKEAIEAKICLLKTKKFYSKSIKKMDEGTNENVE